MSIVVTKEPSDISFSNDPMYVELFSHEIDTDQRATITISINGSLSDGDTFDLIWNNYILNFVARSTYEDDGLDLPLQGGFSDDQYRSNIISVFNRNATFRKFWTATEDGTEIVLSYKTTDALLPVIEGSAPNFSTIILKSSLKNS